MGPIERELRIGMDRVWSIDAWRCIEDSAKSLGVYWLWIEVVDFDADVLSEAIEAAEALGL